MKEINIKLRVYNFKELDNKAQLKIKRLTLSYFKDLVNENTLFFKNGDFYNENYLKKMLKDCEVLE